MTVQLAFSLYRNSSHLSSSRDTGQKFHFQHTHMSQAADKMHNKHTQHQNEHVRRTPPAHVEEGGHSVPPQKRRRVGRQRDARMVGVVVEVQRHSCGGSSGSRRGRRATLVRIHRLRVRADARRRLSNAGCRCDGGGRCRDNRVRTGSGNGAGQRCHRVVSRRARRRGCGGCSGRSRRHRRRRYGPWQPGCGKMQRRGRGRRHGGCAGERRRWGRRRRYGAGGGCRSGRVVRRHAGRCPCPRLVRPVGARRQRERQRHEQRRRGVAGAEQRRSAGGRGAVERVRQREGGRR